MQFLIEKLKDEDLAVRKEAIKSLSKIGGIGTVFHELLHPLIRGCWEAERMKEPISKLAKEDMLKVTRQSANCKCRQYLIRGVPTLGNITAQNTNAAMNNCVHNRSQNSSS